MDHLSIHHPLSDSQWGLQSGKSIVSLLLATTHNWLRILQENSEIGAVFFDLCKVFDSVPHHKLLVKLQQTSLCPHVLNSDYLPFREQRVAVNGKTSEPKAVLSGVPQGSVLGPLLFLIYIDAVAHLPQSEGSQCVLYADDLLLSTPTRISSISNMTSHCSWLRTGYNAITSP